MRREEEERKKEEEIKKKMMEIKKVTEKWKIWDEEKEAARSEENKEVSSRTILQVDQDLWKKSKWEDANKKDVGPYNWLKEEVCTKKRENLFFVQRRERRSESVYLFRSR